jgi:hypothetical protein
MAGLNWVRVDNNLHGNHKVLSLLAERGGDHALCVFIFGLGHSGGQGLAGFIPAAAIGLFHGTKKDAGLLVEVGLWHERPGGWEINDWKVYQPADEEAEARSEKAAHAANVRWERERARETMRLQREAV